MKRININLLIKISLYETNNECNKNDYNGFIYPLYNGIYRRLLLQTLKADNPEEFKFIGNTNNHPVFQLSLNNDEAGSYFINIKDENGNVLYSEKISGVNLSRKYQLDIDDAESNDPGFELSVEVTSEKTHKTQVYKISSNISVVKNFAVVKL